MPEPKTFEEALDETGEDSLFVVPRPDDDALVGASIDLRLGRWFLSLRQSSTTAIPLVASEHMKEIAEADGHSFTDIESRPSRETFVAFGKNFVLHPGSFVLGATLEWIRVPSTLSGYVTGKSSLGRHGLVIEAAAGVHPRFSGCLTLELANTGEVPLQLFPGMVICQLFLHPTTFKPVLKESRFAGRRKPVLGSPRPDKTFAKLIAGEKK